MRDLLPLLAHGSLASADAGRLRAHLGECAACAAELALLEGSRHVLMAMTPQVDTAAIVRHLSAPALTVVPGGARRRSVQDAWWRRVPRQYVAAAASLLIVASLSLPLLKGAFDTDRGTVAPDSSIGPVSGTAEALVPTGLTVGDGLTDLSDADLTALLAELETVQATIAAEPTAMRRPIVDAPEGM
jgi:anti-sigma factor RsiW